MHPFIETQKEWLRDNIPPFRAGDTLRVNVRVREGDKERLQAFEGVCIAKRGAGVSATFTVRKISNGIGVERIFPVHSPMISEITVVRRGRVRRAKLYSATGISRALGAGGAPLRGSCQNREVAGGRRPAAYPAAQRRRRVREQLNSSGREECAGGVDASRIICYATDLDSPRIAQSWVECHGC